MHCFEWRRRKLLCPGTVGRPTSINGQYGSNGSILEVEFILISRGKKLNQNELASILSPIINLTAVLFL